MPLVHAVKVQLTFELIHVDSEAGFFPDGAEAAEPTTKMNTDPQIDIVPLGDGGLNILPRLGGQLNERLDCTGGGLDDDLDAGYRFAFKVSVNFRVRLFGLQVSFFLRRLL